MKNTCWCGILLGVLVLIISGCGGGLLGVIAEKNPPLTENVYGSFGSKILISVPYTLKKESINIPENARSMLSGNEFYGTDGRHAMEIGIANMLYNKEAFPKNRKPNLEGVAEGTINGMAGNKNFSSTKEYINVSGIPAIIVTMIYEDPKLSRHEHKALILVDGYVCWSIGLLYKYDNETARNTAKKVFQSLSVVK